MSEVDNIIEKNPTESHKIKKSNKYSNVFNNKVVIVTGASSGIGKACALTFASYNAKVVLAARKKESLLQVEKEITQSGGQALCVVTDISKEVDCKKLINKTIEVFGCIDILINNAGVSMRAIFEELDLNVIKQVMDTNFYGTVFCTKYALPHIQKTKGTIIGMSSITGLTPLPGRTGYAASKYAMDGFLNTLRLEVCKDNINVLTVHPGFTSSNVRYNALTKDGSAQGETPRTEEKMMSSERLAYIIVKAVAKRKHNLTLTFQGKLIVWIHHNMPRLADRLILNVMKKEPKTPVK